MIAISEEVVDALATGTPVVALESTVFSELGLPAPRNGDALERCLAAVRSAGAIPAVTAVLDGVATIGAEPELVLAGSTKVAERDLPVATATGLAVGVTTVSATVALADHAGITVFATGGIGGVHRGDDGDVSADLDALARHPVITVSSGAKAFLDLGRTLEDLETRGVPVLGYRCDVFPSFYCRISAWPVPHRVDTPEEVASIYRASRALNLTSGVLVANPVPVEAEVPADITAPALDAAVSAASSVAGPAVTLFVLQHVARQLGDAGLDANVALVEDNARVAAAMAAKIAA